jgi:hypothetical protein
MYQKSEAAAGRGLTRPIPLQLKIPFDWFYHFGATASPLFEFCARSIAPCLPQVAALLLSNHMNLGTRWRWGVTLTLLLLYLRGENLRYPLNTSFGGCVLVWTLRRTQKSLVPGGDRTTIPRSYSTSLVYWVCYPAHPHSKSGLITSVNSHFLSIIRCLQLCALYFAAPAFIEHATVCLATDGNSACKRVITCVVMKDQLW